MARRIGLAALARVGAVTEIPPDLVELAMEELGLTSSR